MSERSYTYYGVLVQRRTPDSPVGIKPVWTEPDGTHREETFTRSLEWLTPHGRSWLYRDDWDETLVEIDQTVVQRFIEKVTKAVEAESTSFQKLKSMKTE